MSEDDTPQLTDRQKEVLATLPADKYDIADSLNIGPTTAKDHIAAIRNHGVGVPFDEQAGQYYIQDERKAKLRRISTKHKGTKTREANNLIENEETYLLRRLNQTEPISIPAKEAPDSKSLISVFGDVHVGDLVEDDHGNVLYNTKAADNVFDAFAEKTIRKLNEWSNYSDFSDGHLFLVGDIATGEGIYEGQVHDIETYLSEQVTVAVNGLFRLAKTLSEHFQTLNIYCVLGNHGQVRASGVSKQANTDLIVYRWLDDALRRSDIDNVGIDIAESTHHLNTEIRNWNVHVRHGQDSKKHVDKTRSSESEWRGWRDKHKYHLAVRGHHHNPSVDYVLNKYPVLTAPSPKSGGEYIERLGSPDVSDKSHLGWVATLSEGELLGEMKKLSVPYKKIVQ